MNYRLHFEMFQSATLGTKSNGFLQSFTKSMSENAVHSMTEWTGQ